MAKPRAAPLPFVREGARPYPLLRPALDMMLVCALVLSAVGVICRGVVTISLALVCALSFMLALALLDRGRASLAGTLALVVPLLCAAVAMWLGDGLRDVAVMVLPVVMLLGCLILERPYSTLLVATAVGLSLIVSSAELLGFIPTHEISRASPVDYIVAPVLLGGLGVVAEMVATALMRSERSYREIFNATHEAIFVHDAESGAIVDVNQRSLAMYGYQREALLGLAPDDLASAVSPRSPSQAVQLVRRASADTPQFFEWIAKRQDGSEFWVEATLRRVHLGGVLRLLAVVRDIDARKRSAAQAIQSEKLRSLGLLAGGVAHDFNNQLAVIGGLAQLLALRANEPSVVAEHAGQIVEATRRAAELTSKLLTFARKGASRDEAVDLKALVTETAELLRRSLARRVEVRVEVHSGRAVVHGDPAQLANALLNLGINARDAMPDGGTLTFRTFDLELDAAAAAAADVERGRYAAVAVIDTGAGMSEDVLSQAFEPFFTTKADGTGMGLAQVYGAARAHHGYVRAESRHGAGSRVTVFLPLVDVESTPSSTGIAVGAGRLGYSVLLAEDDERLGITTRQLLEQLGCEVEVCADGEAAVAAYARRPGVFDVVLLDLAMPKRSGAAALADLRRIDPKVPVVITSGYASGAEVEQLLAAGAAAFVPKPATLSALVRALRRAVKGGRERVPGRRR